MSILIIIQSPSLKKRKKKNYLRCLPIVLDGITLDSCINCSLSVNVFSIKSIDCASNPIAVFDNSFISWEKKKKKKKKNERKKKEEKKLKKKGLFSFIGWDHSLQKKKKKKI